MKWSEDRKDLVAALVKVAAEIEDPTKDRKVTAGTKGVYKYATLASFLPDVRRALAAQGVALVQGVGETYTVGVMTTLSHTSGQWVEAFVPLAGEHRTAQDFESAMSYAKRYGILSALGLSPEDDDDGAAASKRPSAMPRDEVKPKQTQSSDEVKFPDRAPPVGQRTAEPLDKNLKETDAEREQRIANHDAKWEADRPRFMAALAKLEFGYDEVCDFQEWRSQDVREPATPPKGKPSTIGRQGRKDLLDFLGSSQGATVYAKFLAARQDALGTAA